MHRNIVLIPALFNRYPANTRAIRYQTNLSLYSVTAVILLDSAGNCVLSKYYDPLHPAALPSSEQKKATGPNAAGTAVPVPTSSAGASAATANSLQGFANPFKSTKEQRAFEKGLFEKTRKGSGECASKRASAVRREPASSASSTARKDHLSSVCYSSGTRPSPRRAGFKLHGRPQASSQAQQQQHPMRSITIKQYTDIFLSSNLHVPLLHASQATSSSTTTI